MSTQETPGLMVGGASIPLYDMRDLLSDLGDELEFLWEEDGSLSTRRRSGGDHRSTGPILARAESIAAMRNLLSQRPHASTCSCATGGIALGHTADAIRPKLEACGLDLRQVLFSEQVVELIVINPGDPSRGRVVVDRNGLVEWDHWCPARDAVTGELVVSVIVAALSTSRAQAVVPGGVRFGGGRATPLTPPTGPVAALPRSRLRPRALPGSPISVAVQDMTARRTG
jgi:hypothetical protein